MGGISDFQVDLNWREKIAIMHTANWSSSHECFFYRLTLVLRSLNKTDISIIWQNLSGIRIIRLCATFLFFLLVMVNLCQPNSAMRCQDTWTNIISKCVYEGNFYKINTWISNWIKQVSLPNMGEPHPISWEPEQNKKADSPARRSSSCLAAWVGSSALSCLWTQSKTSAHLRFPIIWLFN